MACLWKPLVIVSELRPGWEGHCAPCYFKSLLSAVLKKHTSYHEPVVLKYLTTALFTVASWWSHIFRYAY